MVNKVFLEIVIKVAVEKVLLACLRRVKKAIEHARDKSR